MVTEFRLPELGEDIETGDVINVLISAGDNVTEEQPIMEIETDKATIEVPAPVTGVVKEVHVKEGDKIKVGQLLVTFDGAGGREKEEAEGELKVEEVKTEETKVEAAEEGKVEPEEAQERTEEARDEDGEEAKEARAEDGEDEGEKKKERAKAEADRKREKEKKKAEPKEEQEEQKEKKRAKAEAEEGEPKEKATPKERQGEVVEFGRKAKAAEVEAHQEPAPAAPSVRRLARELGVDISQVPGSGPGGRISEEDVKNFARWVITRGIPSGAEVPPTVAPTTPAPLPDFKQWGEVERKPMTNVRRKTAEVMSSAWTTIPHVTQHDKADITNLEKLRKEFGKKAEEAGGKLTVTAVLLKVVSSALRVFPQVNATVDMASQEIIYKKYYNIGVAVDTERGLYVPVIRDVDKKNIVELSLELMQMAEKARNRKLSPEEMKGGTFTVSNQGTIGGVYFSPIINWPEVAILGISRARVEPVFTNGQFEPRLMMPLSLSHDHRVIDGADAVRFLRWIVEALEEPFKMILEG